MGTPVEDQQLRDALGSAADAMWGRHDDGPPRRRGLRAGVAVAVAAVVVTVAVVVAALGSSPPARVASPTRHGSLVPGGTRRGASVPAAGTGGGAGSAEQGAGSATSSKGFTYGASQPATPATHAAPGASSSSPGASTVPSLPTGIVGQSAKVEMNGSAAVTVRRGSLGSAVSALGAMAVGSGGYVSSSSVQTGSPSPVPLPVTPEASSTSQPHAPVSVAPAGTADVTLEIPVASYQSVVNRLGTVGRVTSLSTQAADVTGQYTDLQARITALQASRQQYLTIMTQATTISDILAVQNQVDQLQSQIEQLQGQLNLLDSETTYGTLAVSVVEAGVHVHTHQTPPHPARGGLSQAWHDAVSGFLAGVDGLVRISGPLLFALVLLAAMLALVRWFRRPARGGR